jgi:hypothetical protein
MSVICLAHPSLLIKNDDCAEQGNIGVIYG